MPAFLSAFLSGLPEMMPGDALLQEGEAPAGHPLEARFTVEQTHVVGCACCTGRSSAARALSTLFLARARSSGAPFARVAAVATPAGKAAILEALANDVLASQWFRVA